MMTNSPTSDQSASPKFWGGRFVHWFDQRPRLLRFVDWFFVLYVFAAYVAMPIPEVNEPHYLAKAKHYWNPTWCAGDQFLESTDAHQVFCWTMGWLTLFLPLKTVACLGRIVVLLLQSWSWQKLSHAIFPRVHALYTAILLVIISDNTQIASEWILGGVEAKGFAFALLFLALEALVHKKWNRVWLFLGGATAFHVLVGGWSAIVCAGIWVCSGRERPSLKSMWTGLCGFTILAAPSVWFGLKLSFGVDPAVVAEAQRIQYIERIPHHLNPFAFIKTTVNVTQLALFVAGVAAFSFYPSFSHRTFPRREKVKVVVWFMVGSAVIALAGLLIALATQSSPNLAAGILRFYWFRLFDVALPIGVAFVGFAFLSKWKSAAITIVLLCLPIGYWLRYSYRDYIATVPRADNFVADEQDWQAACAWASSKTEPTDLFLTPAQVGTFKMYANRPEVATRKDMPQDPTSVVEWWRRMLKIHRAPEDDPNDPTSGPTDRWRLSLGTLGNERLRSLADEYHAKYVIVVKEWQVLDHSKPPVKIPLPLLDFPLVYTNPHYAIYRFSSDQPAAK